ncbi:MAG TPA: tetratricopeptide repeat protein [Acidobacteriaceae bacterium]|jgi:Flp pilus assembly protein TadD|nr:tetratricopeptide repeat protein [Acidobacteriaceae bacterium]
MKREIFGRKLSLCVGSAVWALSATGQQASPPAPAPNARPDAATTQQPTAQGLTGREPGIQSSQPSDPILAECLALIEKRQYPVAADKIHAYLRDHPNAAAAHFLLGYALYRQNQPRESLAEYTSAARLQKPEANDLAVVAMDYVLLRDYPDADKWLTKATAWSPGNEMYWYYLGRTKYAENHFQESIEVFSKCLTLAPRDVRAEYNLGLSYAGLGKNDEAAAAYRTAIGWQQGSTAEDPQPYLDLGMLLLQEGKPDLALQPLQKAVALDPKNPRAHEQLGQTWEQLKNLPQADTEMQAAVSLAPDVSSLHFEMGRIFQREGLGAKAKAEFDRCAALNATHSTESVETPNPAPPQ